MKSPAGTDCAKVIVMWGNESVARLSHVRRRRALPPSPPARRESRAARQAPACGAGRRGENPIFEKTQEYPLTQNFHYRLRAGPIAYTRPPPGAIVSWGSSLTRFHGSRTAPFLPIPSQPSTRCSDRSPGPRLPLSGHSTARLNFLFCVHDTAETHCRGAIDTR